MNSTRLMDIIKNGNIVIPLYLLKNYKRWELSMEEFIFMMYLYHLGDHFIFNPNKMMEELNLTLEEVMSRIDSLTSKGLIRVEVLEGDKGLKEDVVSLEGFYQKITLFLVDEMNQKEEDDSNNVFSLIEKEFGRTLSPLEFEIIKAWLDNNVNGDVIREAVKEATLNGVSNLRYIDKILYEWGKAGIRTVQDVENMKKNRKKKEDKNDSVDMDIVDWNWFDEDE